MSHYLDMLHAPSDLKALTEEQCGELAEEIRAFLIEKVSRNGGHLSSNLGDVELTLALHRVFDLPKDKLIWDVGHQAYTHKILTGRAEGFGHLRHEGGVSGFPRRGESEYDLFDAGHASSAISLAYGMAVARDRAGEKYAVVSVVGDGALTGGLSYEAMNNAGKSRHKLIVILNDNAMAIAHSVGGMSNHLSLLRSNGKYLQSKREIKNFMTGVPLLRPLYKAVNEGKDRLKYAFIKGGIIFEEMGFTYLGPVDGHDIGDMEAVFRQAIEIEKPVIIHVRTQKGRGYAPAEQNPELYHGVGAFDPAKGAEPSAVPTYSRLFGSVMEEFAAEDPRIQVVTAAMAYGCGLSRFEERFPDRLHDVGIAEEHGVSFAAGLARAGERPYVAIYSTFLQRAYDQVAQDLCLNRLPVTLAIDRAGITGEDGETHQGIYDIAYLSHIPGFCLMAPASAREMRRMLEFSRTYEGPLGLRYPKGESWEEPEELPSPAIEPGRGRLVREGSGVAVLALGACLRPALEAAKRLAAEGTEITVADPRFASPVDSELILRLARTHEAILTVEDHVRDGGFGMRVAAFLAEQGLPCRVKVLALPDAFIGQGSRGELLRRFGLDAEGILRAVKELG